MSKYRWIVLWLLTGFGCFPVSTPTDDGLGVHEGKGVAVTRPSGLTAALAALECPSPARYHINQPVSPTHGYQRFDYYEDCPDAIDLLTTTTFPVEADLLRLAESDRPLPTRYRAVHILAHRKKRSAGPILLRMGFAEEAVERYVAWSLYHDAVEKKWLSPPAVFGDILALYQKEKDAEVRARIAYFFGAARARVAVPVLLEALRNHPRDYGAIAALGEIGDSVAVPALIAAYDHDEFGRYSHCEALGKLATPEAVDFLIAHMDQHGAVEALVETRSHKALPALKRHLDTLAGQPNELSFATARVAVTQLSHAEPAPHLLALAEERPNSEWLRHLALRALQAEETTALHPRLLRLFRDDADLTVKGYCVRLLATSSLDGVTEALVERTLASAPSGDYREQGLQDDLRKAMNERLGWSCRTVEALRERLRNRP